MSTDDPVATSSPPSGPSIDPLIEQAAAIALQDAVAYLRSMQTISVATVAMLRRRLLDASESPELAVKQVQATERAMMDAVDDAFSVYARALETAKGVARDRGSSPHDTPDGSG